MGQVADFQACTVAVALWAAQCVDAEQASVALRTAKRLQKQQLTMRFQFAEVLLRVHRRTTAGTACSDPLLVNPTATIASHKHSKILALHPLFPAHLPV